jgi:hypothetical protein
MAREDGGGGAWFTILVCALALMMAAAGWLFAREITARHARLAMVAPPRTAVPTLPRGPQTPPIPIPRPPS